MNFFKFTCPKVYIYIWGTNLIKIINTMNFFKFTCQRKMAGGGPYLYTQKSHVRKMDKGGKNQKNGKRRKMRRRDIDQGKGEPPRNSTHICALWHRPF